MLRLLIHKHFRMYRKLIGLAAIYLPPPVRAISKGVPGGGFDPEGMISGAEMAVILSRALTETDPAVQSEPYWYSHAVEICRQYQLLGPNYEDFTPVSRAECAYSMVQLLYTLEGMGE